MSDEEQVIKWTPENWVTTVLMAATAFVGLAIIATLTPRPSSSIPARSLSRARSRRASTWSDPRIWTTANPLRFYSMDERNKRHADPPAQPITIREAIIEARLNR